jgi:molecular chaperone IbpA
MRTTLDFSPFYRSSIGFDRLFNLLDDASRNGSSSGAPNYDIARAGEDAYRITIAVPGFAMDQLEITQQPNMLQVTGNAPENDNVDYLHRGIASRSFVHRFELADFVEVASAALVNGLLTIELKREVPEAMKPRRIDIASDRYQAPEPKQIGDQKAA